MTSFPPDPPSTLRHRRLNPNLPCPLLLQHPSRSHSQYPRLNVATVAHPAQMLGVQVALVCAHHRTRPRHLLPPAAALHLRSLRAKMRAEFEPSVALPWSISRSEPVTPARRFTPTAGRGRRQRELDRVEPEPHLDLVRSADVTSTLCRIASRGPWASSVWGRG
jgi:hypothetical protein